MVDTKVSALTAAGTLTDTDVLYIINSSLDRKVTLNQLTSYFESRARQHNAVVTNQTIGAADTYVTNSFITIPANRLQAKSKFKYEFSITKAAAGTGTPVVTVRFGTAGTTADAAILTFTWPAANTAVADEMKLSIMGTFRTVGSVTSAVVEGMMTAEHELTTTGFGGTGLGANIIVNATSAGFNSTTASAGLGVSINGSTAASWTLRQGWGVLENLA